MTDAWCAGAPYSHRDLCPLRGVRRLAPILQCRGGRARVRRARSRVRRRGGTDREAESLSQAEHPSIFSGLPPSERQQLDGHVHAALAATNARTFSNRTAYVFDSTASFQRARQLMPALFGDRKGSRIVHGNETSESGCAMHRENVFVQASYDECARVRSILAGLS
jgi:hypothetical protein